MRNNKVVQKLFNLRHTLHIEDFTFAKPKPLPTQRDEDMFTHLLSKQRAAYDRLFEKYGLEIPSELREVRIFREELHSLTHRC
jgi:trehalose/maltose hydrolase-like predicted phosphorylase